MKDKGGRGEERFFPSPMPFNHHQLEQRLRRIGELLQWREQTPYVSRDVHADFMNSLTPLERLAVKVSEKVGSIGFFLCIVTWSLFWLSWNTLAPKPWRFDPAPAFVLWLFLSNLIQLTLLPLILLGQNLDARRAQLTAEADYAINRKAEFEVELLLFLLLNLQQDIQQLLPRSQQG